MKSSRGPTRIETINDPVSMPSLEIPDFRFNQWQRYVDRPRISSDPEVPLDFGLYGLYLIARSNVDLNETARTAPKYLQSEVIYIGMSSNVERRLELPHAAVKRHRREYVDPNDSQLWVSIWHAGDSEFSASRRQNYVANASLALYERIVILAYIREFGRPPQFNSN